MTLAQHVERSVFIPHLADRRYASGIDPNPDNPAPAPAGEAADELRWPKNAGRTVLIVSRPSALATRYAFRESDTYANDVRVLIGFARARSSTPAWLLGHSLGTNAVASVAARRTDGQIAGVVFIAATINGMPHSGITETVFGVLVSTHAHDACPPASPEGSARLRATVTGSPATDLLVFDGGEPGGGPCDPTALHSLVKLDTKYVARISAWMREHTRIQQQH